MQSPIFPQKGVTLTKIIDVGRLKSTWKRVRVSARRQVIPDPIEHLDFHVALGSICENILNEIEQGAYLPRSPHRVLSEKTKGLCRQLVLPTTRDSLVLQVLSDSLWAVMKTKAPSANSFYAPADNSFSKATSSFDYGSKAAWGNFQKRILGFTKQYEFVIVTDIVNYYDSISHEHLRNILADKAEAREVALDLLIFSLSHLLWQPDYMPSMAVGLPQIDLDAPRLLAHCFLYELDGFLTAIPDAAFARFMDDIDIGVDSVARAKTIIKELDLTLQCRQIRLNSGKTRILNKSEASRYYCIRENKLISDLAEAIRNKNEVGLNLEREVEFVTYALDWGFRTGLFSRGYGEKILKRLISVTMQLRQAIPASILQEIMLNYPALREICLAWRKEAPNNKDSLEVLTKILGTGQIVDDTTLLYISRAVVDARIPMDKGTKHSLKQLGEGINKSGHDFAWRFYSNFWLTSRYGDQTDLMHLLESNAKTWGTNECLSRLVAGAYPRFLGGLQFDKFTNIIGKSLSRPAIDVVEFHNRVSTTIEGFQSVRKFLLAKNESLPNKITHSKFLMVLSVLKAKVLLGKPMDQITQAHSFAFSDQFYSALL